MPVLPEVGSRIVWPGRIRPFSSASSIMLRATRSLTEPVGLNDSILAQMRTPGLGESGGSSTSGVLPMAWTRSVKGPPQGRLASGGRADIALQTVARWVARPGAPGHVMLGAMSGGDVARERLEGVDVALQVLLAVGDGE